MALGLLRELSGQMFSCILDHFFTMTLSLIVVECCLSGIPVRAAGNAGKRGVSGRQLVAATPL